MDRPRLFSFALAIIPGTAWSFSLASSGGVAYLVIGAVVTEVVNCKVMGRFERRT